MSSIKKISVENFRQFDRLEIDNLKMINFLVGENGCGKTSILEAIYWGTSSSFLPLKDMYAYRDIKLKKEFIKTLFYRNKENSKISIDLDTYDGFHCGFSMELSKNSENNIEIKYDVKDIDSTIYDYDIRTNSTNIKSNFKNKLISSSEGVQLQDITKREDIIKDNNLDNLPDKSLIDNYINVFGNTIFVFRVSYLNDKIKSLFIPTIINRLIVSSKENELIKYLKRFDSRVSQIAFDMDKDVLIELEENNEKFKLPLNLMGDGFVKFLNIVASLLDTQNPIKALLIDEIENGLYHINIKKMLREIINLSKDMNIQMFITTHSYETLKFLSEVIQEEQFLEQKDNIQVLRISCPNGQYKTYSLSMETLEHNTENDIEIR